MHFVRKNSLLIIYFLLFNYVVLNIFCTFAPNLLNDDTELNE